MKSMRQICKETVTKSEPIITDNMMNVRVPVDKHLLDIGYDQFRRLMQQRYGIKPSDIPSNYIKAYIFNVGLKQLSKEYKAANFLNIGKLYKKVYDDEY